MSWHPADLVSDMDLRDYEDAVMGNFGQTTWHGKRTKAFDHWLFPILKSRGFDPQRLRTRAEPTQVWGYTASAYTDFTSSATDSTEDDLDLGAIFATPSTDALYVGFTEPSRGLFVRMQDTPTAVAGVLSVAYWNGNWENVLITDGTQATDGVPFSGGGSVTWLLPGDWMTRKVNASASLYYLKVTTSATPTSALSGQLSLIRGSSLSAPATFRTLQLIFQEAPTSQDGPWKDKAAFYEKEADAALSRALLICGGDFDSDGSDTISPDEAAQTPDSVSGGPWSLERA